METVAGGEYPEPTCAASREFDRGFYRLGAAIGEHDMSEAGRRDGDQSLRDSPAAGEIDVTTRFGRDSCLTVSSARQIGSGW